MRTNSLQPRQIRLLANDRDAGQCVILCMRWWYCGGMAESQHCWHKESNTDWSNSHTNIIFVHKIYVVDIDSIIRYWAGINRRTLRSGAGAELVKVSTSRHKGHGWVFDNTYTYKYSHRHSAPAKEISRGQQPSHVVWVSREGAVKEMNNCCKCQVHFYLYIKAKRGYKKLRRFMPFDGVVSLFCIALQMNEAAGLAYLLYIVYCTI